MLRSLGSLRKNINKLEQTKPKLGNEPNLGNRSKTCNRMSPACYGRFAKTQKNPNRKMHRYWRYWKQWTEIFFLAKKLMLFSKNRQYRPNTRTKSTIKSKLKLGNKPKTRNWGATLAPQKHEKAATKPKHKQKATYRHMSLSIIKILYINRALTYFSFFGVFEESN